MKRGFLSLILPLASLSMCGASDPHYFGEFVDQVFSPLSKVEDKDYEFSFISNVDVSTLVKVYIRNAVVGNSEYLYQPKTPIAFYAGVKKTMYFTVPFDVVASTDNNLTFEITALTSIYAGQVIKKSISIPCADPIIGRNVEPGAELKGNDCYFAFRNGELVKGCGRYVVGEFEKEIYDPKLNFLPDKCFTLTYFNDIALPRFSGTGHLAIYSGYDQYDIGTEIRRASSWHREISGSVLVTPYKDRLTLTFALAGTYAVSLMNLEMKDVSLYESGTSFKSNRLFFPVGKGPLDTVYSLYLWMEDMFETGDSLYIGVKVHRTKWHFGPSFYSDYAIGVGEASHA